METLDFERPLNDLEHRIENLKGVARDVGAAAGEAVEAEIQRLEESARALRQEVFEDLGAWEKVKLSRHPSRPYTLDYIARLIDDFTELHGDRLHGDDQSIVGGVGRFRAKPVMVVGHQKGRGVKENVARNFGMPHPEGYRKSRRLMELADRFGLPVLTFIDTPGAYPGIAAEERGQAEAIGQALLAMARLRVPVVATVIGEGGSGGALALGVANRVLILEYGTYSVISPEGCASILWKDGTRAAEAAEALRLTAPHLYRLGVVDEVIAEPEGGAHRDHDESARRVGDAIARQLDALAGLGPEALVEDRYRRFRAIGEFVEE